MKKIQDVAGFFFIIAVAVLSVISILGIWDFFDKDVISKSFQTIGLLAFVAIVVMIAGRFIDRGPAVGIATPVPNPVFKSIRHLTLGILIVSASLLALLGVLAIWEVIADKDVLFKSIGSVAVLAFSSFLMVITCLEREGSALLHRNKSISVGGTIVLLLLAYLIFSVFGRSIF